MNTSEYLYEFGKLLINIVRDQTIKETYKIINGESKSSLSIKLHERLGTLSPEQSEAYKALIIDCIDRTLNNFLWFLEQEEQLDLISYQEGKSYSLKEISDGLSVDYWNFVDKFSKYERIS